MHQKNFIFNGEKRSRLTSGTSNAICGWWSPFGIIAATSYTFNQYLATFVPVLKKEDWTIWNSFEAKKDTLGTKSIREKMPTFFFASPTKMDV